VSHGKSLPVTQEAGLGGNLVFGESFCYEAISDVT
jgi:hypothetical protein